ncbi:hypothetical protein MFIFM68171_01410 [Madurella fahalii]|uniref:Uncharacterized protein n=1 Tax=Madurella fahalii TaxID=1157608 RepID=A0ABQ0G0B6_9PEZI
MPRFSVAFTRRKSTADAIDNAAATGPSFRVLDRSEVLGSKAFDGGVKLATTTTTRALHRPTRSDVTAEDNIFADLKPNRGSGSSNTTKTTSTDNSSRHSNASTAPSSADTGIQEDWRNAQRKPPTDIPVPPIPKSSSTGFLKAAGRTFSFGGQKKHLPQPPVINESPPSSPAVTEAQTPANGRSRATTTSTSTTVTPPRVDGDFDLDLGGDFGKLMLGNDKRASVATLKNDQYARQAPAPRSLTGPRVSQPAPIQIDTTTKIEPPAHSWSSQHSNDQLIAPASPSLSPPSREFVPPPVPRHASPSIERRPVTSPEVGPKRPLLSPPMPNTEQEEAEDEEARLLKDSLSAVTGFITGTGSTMPAGSPSGSRYRRNENALDGDNDSLFDTGRTYSSKYSGRYTTRKNDSPPSSHKVMTPAEFEKYRKDKERQDREREAGAASDKPDGDQDDDDNYEDDEDDLEKAKQQAKQRRKQEAHMAVYRQQMMKVTGESGNTHSPRSSLQISFSTPNLPDTATMAGPGAANTSENSDEDEEIPLAILAAHGFPNKNRPPTRLSTMMSNPNLRGSQQPSYQRPVSTIGEMPATGNARLPAFARNLPQDPFVGAGLVRNSVRESFSLGGGAGAPGQPGAPVPPGGLIGVIANEERSRALRRGSPHLDGQNRMSVAANFDPIAGIPPHMMYQNPPTLSAGDQAQIQMTQQMQQFMQMQMQFMQMMANQNSSGHMSSSSLGNTSAMGGMPGTGMMPGTAAPEMRHSFVGNDSMLDLPFGRGETQMRTMSMVQPSSASWIQPPKPGGYAPSIRIQGGAGYAPSIAPSERSNIGLPGRYRPVSHVPAAQPALPGHMRKSSTMSGAIQQPSISVTQSGSASDDDDEEGWEAMKAKREKKKSMWRSKQSISSDLGAFIS